MFIARQKLLYVNLNMLRQQQHVLIGYFWAPLLQQNVIQTHLANIPAVRMQEIDNKEMNFLEPTYFKLNDLTMPFHMIVDMYGTPNY